MSVFYIVVIVLVLSGLIADFQRDRKQHIKAKIFQALFLFPIILFYSGAFRYLIWIPLHFSKLRFQFSSDVGIVPGNIHFIIFLAHTFLSITILVLAYRMVKRNEKARWQFIRFFPLLAVTETFNFYRGWLSDGGIEIDHFWVFLIGFIVMGGLIITITIIFNTNFMKSFYNPNFESPVTESETILDLNISKVNDNSKTDQGI